MDPLAKPLRRQLEDAIVKARDLAEQAALSMMQTKRSRSGFHALQSCIH